MKAKKVGQRIAFMKLLLRLFLGLSCLLGRALLAHAVKSLVRAFNAQRSVGSLRLVLGSNGLYLDLRGRLDNGHELVLQLGSHGQLVLGSLTRLGLGRVLREDQELRLVFLEPLDVVLHGVKRAILPARVNGNANGRGVPGRDAGLLELLDGEAAAQAKVHVVLVGLAADDRAQGAVNRARGLLGVLGGAGAATAALAHRLVEPAPHSQLPLLAEVVVRDDIVVLHLASLLRAGPDGDDEGFGGTLGWQEEFAYERAFCSACAIARNGTAAAGFAQRRRSAAMIKV